MAQGLAEWVQTHSLQEFFQLLEDNHCPQCKTEKPVKLRRQYVHHIGYRIHVCVEQGIKPMSKDRKPGS